MIKKITIAIDAMGGENSPDKTIKGVKYFLDKNKNNQDFFINLFGDEQKNKEKLNKYKIKTDLVKISHTNSVVSDEETPLTAAKIQKIQVCGVVSNHKSKESLILVYQQVTLEFYLLFQE